MAARQWWGAGSPIHYLARHRLQCMWATGPKDDFVLVSNVTNDDVIIGSAVRADFRRLYPANAKTPTCCPSDDNRTKVTNSVTSARSLWWHVGPYFWPADLTRTANPIVIIMNPAAPSDMKIVCLATTRGGCWNTVPKTYACNMLKVHAGIYVDCSRRNVSVLPPGTGRGEVTHRYPQWNTGCQQRHHSKIYREGSSSKKTISLLRRKPSIKENVNDVKFSF